MKHKQHTPSTVVLSRLAFPDTRTQTILRSPWFITVYGDRDETLRSLPPVLWKIMNTDRAYLAELN